MRPLGHQGGAEIVDIFVDFRIFVQEVAGKGRGLVATKDISRGDIILKDRAVVTASDHDCSATKIQPQVDQLSKADRDDYYKLCAIKMMSSNHDGSIISAENDKHLAGLSKSSAIFFNCAIDNGKGFHRERDPEGLGNLSRSVYLGLSWMNHSCFANCALVSTTDTDTLELITVVDVKKGEELTINYLGSASLMEPTAWRREILRGRWDFFCDCLICIKGW